MTACRANNVVHYLQQATLSATPVTLDLNQITLSTEQHLHALRELCASAWAPVTLSNGKIRLSGAEDPLGIQCTRLNLSHMEVIRVIPKPQRRSEEELASRAGHPRGLNPAMMHPMMQVLEGAQVELHDCHANMVLGTQPVFIFSAGSRLAMTRCTLVEEEGPHLPAASSLPRPGDAASVVVEEGTTLALEHTKVCMPLVGKLALDPYPIHCSGTLSAIDSEFDSTFVSLVKPAPGCRFIRCNFNCHAASHRPRKPMPVALLRCLNVSDVSIEGCVFADAPHRAAIHCMGENPLPLPGGPPLTRIKGTEISNCLYGIEAHMTGTRGPSGRVTLEVEDTTIRLAQSPHARPEECQRGLAVSGAAVSANLTRCTVQTKDAGRELSAISAERGAQLAMRDCTIEHEGLGAAIFLVQSTAPTIIERTTITASMPRELAALGGHVANVIFLKDGSARIVDCKIDGSDRHFAVTVKGSGKIELVKCEVALKRPCLAPWAAVDPGGTVSLKDCVVGTCIEEPGIALDTVHTLDNTIYPPWTDEFKDVGGTPAVGVRNIITATGMPGGMARRAGFQLKTGEEGSSTQQGAPRADSSARRGACSPAGEPSSAQGAGGQGTSSAQGAGADGGGQGTSSAAATTTEGEGDEAPLSCSYCHAYSAGLLACAACGMALYCDRACQKKHWKQGHRQACQAGAK